MAENNEASSSNQQNSTPYQENDWASPQFGNDTSVPIGYRRVVPDSNAYGTPTMDKTDKVLRLIAFISMLFTLAMNGLAVYLSGNFYIAIGFAWTIPITVMTWGIYTGRRENSVLFALLSLFFGSLLTGVLLLISHKD